MTAAMIAAPALAGVTVAPVYVELSAAKRVGQITITNTGTTPVTIQAEAAAWSQQNNTDQYIETGELLVAPAIVEIPAQGSQLFRVTLRGAFPAAGERTFRLYLEDVSEAAADTGINVRVRHDLPVVVAGSRPGKAQPRLHACAAPAPFACVRLENHGDRYVQITGLAIEGAFGRKEIKTGGMILAGAWKQWTIDLPPAFSGPLKAVAETSLGPVSTELAIPAR